MSPPRGTRDDLDHVAANASRTKPVEYDRVVEGRLAILLIGVGETANLARTSVHVQPSLVGRLAGVAAHGSSATRGRRAGVLCVPDLDHDTQLLSLVPCAGTTTADEWIC